MGTAADPVDACVDAALRRWQADLLDLTRANRLLHLAPDSSAGLRLTHPTPEKLFANLTTKRRCFPFYRPGHFDPTRIYDADPGEPQTALRAPRPPKADEIVAEGDPVRIEQILYRLRLRSRALLQEQGIGALFVAFGTLEWAIPTDPEPFRSPLLLVSVKLERAASLDPHTLCRLDEQPLLNPALVRKLAVETGLALTLPDTGERVPTLGEALAHLRAAIGDRGAWRVRANEVHLGLFSFAKYAMYADLEANRERFRVHPIVRAIASGPGTLLDPPPDLPTAGDLDNRLTPAEVYQVLDADASQQEAIAWVKAGVNLVIQGPPGTGKSQTITNLIAEMLAAGKTVLFVSEKMAALRVVAHRLEEAGLRAFVLEAHSQDVDKAEIVRDLYGTWQASRTIRDDSADFELEQLAILRRRLNTYVDALHDRANPLGRSAYDIHGELAARAHLPLLSFQLDEIGKLNQRRLAEIADGVRRLAAVAHLLLDEANHPWRGCAVQIADAVVRDDLAQWLDRLAEAAEALAMLQAELRAAWGLPPAATLHQAVWLRDLLALIDDRRPIPPAWLVLPSRAPLIALAEEQRTLTESYRSRRAAFLMRTSESLLARRDLSALEAIMAAGQGIGARVRGDGTPADRALARAAAVSATVDEFLAAAKQLAEAGEAAATAIGLSPPATLGETRCLNRIAEVITRDLRAGREWFDAARRAELEGLVEEAARRKREAAQAEAELRPRFADGFFALPLAAMKGRFETSYASGFRFFNSKYRRELGQLQKLLRIPGNLSYADALAALRQGAAIDEARSWLRIRWATLAQAAAGWFAGESTDWGAVAKGLADAGELAVLLDGQPLPEAMLSVVSPGGLAAFRDQATALGAALARFETAADSIAAVLDLDDHPWGGLSLDAALLSAAIAWTIQWRDELLAFAGAAEAVRVCRRVPTADVADLLADVREARAIRALEEDIHSAAPRLAAAFGCCYTGIETDWSSILADLAWADRLAAQLGGTVPERLVETLRTGAPTGSAQRHELAGLVSVVAGIVAELAKVFPPGARQIEGQPPEETSLVLLAEWARQRRAVLDRLDEWVDYARAVADAQQAGLQPVVAALRMARLPREVWVEATLRRVYALWLAWRYKQSPDLARFRQQEHEAIVEEFRRLDRRQFASASRRIALRLVAERPPVTLSKNKATEGGLLHHEASKRQRHLPPRQLFARLETFLPKLKPCLLMSPLSVAQFLGESSLEFDLVVFDEASQICPADAIGAIGRGRQVVIVGDRHQLPPTRFFAADVDRHEDESEEGVADAVVGESILEVCERVLPTKRLLWHYRSRHEHLIAFSNGHFYDHELRTFPSPDERRRAVEFVHVPDGIYEPGRAVNRVEARRVADLVVDQVRREPERSVGVVTFSEAQMVAVQIELDRRRRAEPWLEKLLSEEGPEGFFVKNLENVQGDERDVIIFSIGYGPEASGKFLLRFGPVTQRGGERRLNVAVTRAREQVCIVASFLPEAIDLSRTRSRGVQLLRQYLEFAARGADALPPPPDRKSAEGDHLERAVAHALAGRGVRVTPQLGVGDAPISLALQAPESDRFLLAVETDGATYREIPTARDRDRLRPQVLERLGWQVHRVWSMEWVRDPERVLNTILEAYARALGTGPQRNGANGHRQRLKPNRRDRR